MRAFKFSSYKLIYCKASLVSLTRQEFLCFLYKQEV